MKRYLKIPKTFARDRLARGCNMPAGHFIGNTFGAFFDEGQLDDLIKDARYYAQDVDEAPADVVRSARRVVDRFGHMQ